MTLKEFINELNKSGISHKLVSSNSELCISCPFCESNKNGHHMYIKIEKNEVIVYNCFKCGHKGRVNANFLTRLVGDIDTSKYSFSNVSIVKPLTNIESPTWVYNQDYRMEVIEYINSRIGSKYTMDDSSAVYDEYNIVANPIKFIMDNKIQVESTYALNMLKHGVCFLSANKQVILVRNIEKSTNRWFKVPLIDGAIGYGYSIRSSIDLYSPIQIILAEGIFDIISIKYNKICKEVSNSLYLSGGGYTNYKNILKYAIARGIFGNDVTVHIYVDSDKTNVEDYRKMLYVYQSIFGSISLYRNSKGEDFGLPKSKIHSVFMKRL